MTPDQHIQTDLQNLRDKLRGQLGLKGDTLAAQLKRGGRFFSRRQRQQLARLAQIEANVQRAPHIPAADPRAVRKEALALSKAVSRMNRSEERRTARHQWLLEQALNLAIIALLTGIAIYFLV